MKVDKPKKGRQSPGPAEESYMKNTSSHGFETGDALKLLSELNNSQLQIEKQSAELARLREELQESRDKFAAIYDCAPVGFTTLDRQGTVLDANLSLADMLGVPQNNLIGSVFAQYIVLDSLYTFYAHADSVLSQGTRQYCELRLKKNDGAVLYAGLESIALRDASGNLSRYQAVIMDMSDQAKNIQHVEAVSEGKETLLTNGASSQSPGNEEISRRDVQTSSPGGELQTGEDLAGQKPESTLAEDDLIVKIKKVLIETAGDALIATDKNLEITQWNQGAADLYGWTTEEVMEGQAGGNLRERVLGILTRDDVIQSITTTGAWKGEALAFKKDGYGLNVRVSISVLWDDTGNFDGLMTLHKARDSSPDSRAKTSTAEASPNAPQPGDTPPEEDPSESADIQDKIEACVKERTEELLKANLILRQEMNKFKHAALIAQESEGKNRDLVDNIKLGIFRSTPGTKGKFLEVNIAMEEITGYSRDELLTLNVCDLFPEKSKNLLTDGVGLANWKDTRELDIVKRNGDQLTVAENIMTIRYDSGQILYFDGILEDITERKRSQQQIQQSLERLQKTIKEIIQAMAYIGEVRDPYTAGHQRRVAQLSFEIGRMVGLKNEQFEGLMMAAFVHDIGKIIVPADILSKPGILTRPEFDMIKDHARIGYEILKNIEFPWPIAKIVLQHHERLDGSGYPSGLKHEDIILEARILAVADVVEAMSSHRPYRPALGLEKALAEISQNKGTLYDSTTVEACIRLFNEKGFNLN
jgi:PAS domain S-box-containing protein